MKADLSSVSIVKTSCLAGIVYERQLVGVAFAHYDASGRLYRKNTGNLITDDRGEFVYSFYQKGKAGRRG